MRDERCIAGLADAPARAYRMNARAKQRFRRIDVADSDDHVRIHDEVLHGTSPARGAFMQVGGREPGIERFGSEGREELMAGRIAGRPNHQPKASRIAQPQDPAGAEVDLDMVVGKTRLGRIDDTQTAGHPEMNDEGAGFETEQQILCPTLDVLEPLTGQDRRERRRHGQTQTRLVDNDTLHL